MQYTINQFYDIIHQKVYDIRDIFNNFFGEENVDLHLVERNKMKLYKELTGSYEGFYGRPVDHLYEVSDEVLEHLKNPDNYSNVFILVHFPHVTVTNDNNKTVNIQDLYAKVVINLKGNIPFEFVGFELNRSTYTKLQFLSDYMHSHIHYIPKNNFTQFMSPCLGRGPIKGTINSLKIDYDESLWMLFCQELSMYVTVESLKGGPWKRLEELGYGKFLWFNDYSISIHAVAFRSNFNDNILKGFITYYLQQGHLSLSYKEGKFISGMPFYDFIIDISNAFIDYYNQYLQPTATSDKISHMFDTGLLQNVVIRNRTFYKYTKTEEDTNVSKYQHMFVLTFKGKSVYTKILNDAPSEEAITILLNYDVAMYILSKILLIINFRYKNEHRRTSHNSSDTSAYQKVLYI